MFARLSKRASQILSERTSQTKIEIQEAESIADQIIEISKKPQRFRKPYETKILVDGLRNIKFFKEQFEDHYEGMIEDVAENAKLQMFNKHDHIIKQDTYGDIFYILIKGEAKVLKRVVTYLGSETGKKGKKREKYHEIIKEIKTLQEGDYFGELALLVFYKIQQEKKPRGADVVCVQDCYCLTLDKDSFERIMATKTKRQFLHQIDTLSSNSILKELSKQTVKALFMIMERKVYNYGDIVYRQNDPGNCLYFILEGEFKMYTTIEVEPELDDASTTRRKQIEVCILTTNETMGLQEFLDEKKREWRAECQSQIGVVYKLDRVDYKRIENRYPDVVEAIKKIQNDKVQYYEGWKSKHKKLTSPKSTEPKSFQSKFDFINYSNQAKQIKSIIMNEPEMSFISRDQITINDDQEVMLKYSKFFQIGAKPATPFQVNTIEQIMQYRVQSAGYKRTVSKSLGEQIKQRPATAIKTNQSIHETKRKINTASSMQNLITTQIPQDDQEIKENEKLNKQNKKSKIIIKKKHRNHNDIVQAKMQAFMKLTPEIIENMAKEQNALQIEKSKKLKVRTKTAQSVDQILKQLRDNKILASSRRPSSPTKRIQSGRFRLLVTKPLKTDVTIIGERIHSLQIQTPYSTQQLPLKYQLGSIRTTSKKAFSVLSPISNSLKSQKNKK